MCNCKFSTSNGSVLMGGLHISNLSVAPRTFLEKKEMDREIVHKGERNFSSGRKFSHAGKRKRDKILASTKRNTNM